MPPTLTEKITAAHDRFAGWTYGQPPGVPELLPGIPRAVPVGTGQTDCTTYAAWVLLASHGGLRGIDGLWAALSVWDRATPWSGIEVLQGMGYPSGDPVSPGWYWVQSWSGLAGGRVVEAITTGPNKRPASSGHGRLLHVELVSATVYEARSTDHRDGTPAGVVRRRVSLGAWRTWGKEVRAARLG